MEWHRHEAEHRGDIDDPSRSSLAHARQHLLRQANGPPKIGLQLSTRFSQRGLLDSAEECKARVIDQHIDMVDLPPDIVHGRADALVGAHIELNHLDVFRSGMTLRLPARTERTV